MRPNLGWQAAVGRLAQRKAEAVGLPTDVAGRGGEHGVAGDGLSVKAATGEKAEAGDPRAGPEVVKTSGTGHSKIIGILT